MAFGADPFSVLGLPRGSSQAEIKRAYRRLAKAFHPDTAGEGAIPRFLAIQAAYDLLTGQTSSPGTFGTSGRRGGTAGPARGGGGAARGSGGAGGGAAGGARRPGWWADPERGRAARGRGAPDGTAGPGRGGNRGDATGGTPGTRPRRGNRQPGRATPGSTTYDEADVDPFDPEWSGGSWYGTTSGTYWTINPREYADPRKHGPEYQARARRRAETDDADWSAGATTNDAAGPIGTGARTGGRADPLPGASSPPEGPPQRPFQPPADPPPPPGDGVPADPLAALPLPGGPGRRVAVALLGWPPLGIAIAWLLGEVSGCGRFSAGCVETFAVGTWVAQFAVLGVLLLVPALAAASAVGTVAMLAAALPASILLSAVGGGRQPGAAAGALAIVLAVAWLAGAAFAVGRRSRTIPP
jgi:DnaJ-like protein